MADFAPIAIVGAGGMFPGAPDRSAFWSVVRDGVDTARDVPAERWVLDPSRAVDATPQTPDRVISRRACLLEGLPRDEELSGLALTADDLRGLDPLFRVTLVAGRRAFDRAETDGVDPGRVGVILGNIALPTDGISAWAWDRIGGLAEETLFGTGRASPTVDARNRFVAGMPAGLLARALGLGGGHLALDAACASSLYAVFLAARELQAGRTDMMVTGGVSRPSCLYTQMGFSQLRALSPTGRCAPFDAKGNGLVVGEGAGILILKRLEDALEAGDRILGVLRGAGLSNDRAGSLLAPSTEGQVRALRQAYRHAGWQPGSLDLIECHATGTPIGDATEFRSLATLWEKETRSGPDCVIGSVKSNVGHLLTGAGAAGLFKVLAAFEHETLPPTANFERPAEGVELDDGPFRVLRTAEPWQKRDRPRRAGVNAFGFGGINAHLLLEEGPADPIPVPADVVRDRSGSEPVAIVGLGAAFGPWETTRAVARRLVGLDDRPPEPIESWWGYEKSRMFEEVSGLRPMGYPMGEVRVELGRFRIPPTELEEMLPQQLLMLRVAADALSDAGSSADPDKAALATGTFIGIGLDPNTTNFHLRWALEEAVAEWNVDRDLNLDAEALAAWREELREALSPPLNANRTMGALGGIVASRIAREFQFGGPSFTLSSEESSAFSALEMAVRALQNRELDRALVGGVDLTTDLRFALPFVLKHPDRPLGEGAVAFVLKRQSDAERDGDRIYATIRGIGAGGGGGPDGGPDEAAVLRAVDAAQKETDDAPGIDRMEVAVGAEIPRLGETIQERLGAAPFGRPIWKQLGHLGAAAGAAGLLRTVLSLHHRLLPPDEAGEPRPWVRNRIDGPRRAACLVGSRDGQAGCVLLEEGPAEPTEWIRETRPALFCVTGPTAGAICGRINELLAGRDGETFEDLARRWSTGPEAGERAVALVARDEADLEHLLVEARSRLSSRPEESFSLEGRVFYNPKPPGQAGGLAFVHPGSGNAYRDMGSGWARLLPHRLRKQEKANERLADQLVADRIWTGKEDAELTVQEAIFGQVSVGALVSDGLRTLGLEPDAAIGYSLGESGALFAHGIWSERDAMLRRLEASTLFRTDLAGPCDAVRRAWGLDETETVDWVMGRLDRPVDEVRDALAKRDRVYLQIVNTPESCVVGGDRTAVMELVDELGATFLPLESVSTVHCAVLEPVAEAYRELHTFEGTKPRPGLDVYSGAWGRRYEVTPERAAEAICAQAREGIDFPAVIEAAWVDGIRVFCEVGPGASCTAMIGDILGDRPHEAVSVCMPGREDRPGILRALARLAAAGVPVDARPTLGSAPEKTVPEDRPGVALPIGRPDLRLPPPPEGHHRGEAAVPREAEPSPTGSSRTRRESGPVPASTPSKVSGEDRLVASVRRNVAARSDAHDAFLRFSEGMNRTFSEQVAFQLDLLKRPGAGSAATMETARGEPGAATVQRPERPALFDRDACLALARGRLEDVLGPEFAPVDRFPTRVRLPDEPLMLVDRIVELEGEPRSLEAGRVVTEHDILPGAWYLDTGRIPTCIAVEAGQADLFLSGYLGVDFETRGEAVYRLLDAVVTFHRPLPGPGRTIRYDIRIRRFFRQGETILFRFEFDATVDGERLLTMRDGCAGFFTEAQLAEGRGLVPPPAIEARVREGTDSASPTFLPVPSGETYDARALDALRAGDLEACFGPDFEGVTLSDPLPDGRMRLVDRVVHLDGSGGLEGLGIIRAEADIHPDDWFLTCHFVDDRVMPGTLMYECCLHTLRILLLRMGWVAEDVVCEPVPGVSSRLKCRGQVIPSTRTAAYEVSIKSVGFDPHPHVLADARMFADGKPIVEITDMSLQMRGTSREELASRWSDRTDGRPETDERFKPALYDRERILAFATGKPSEAFGEKYRVFDEERVIARLPGPPYQFLDRITAVSGEPWKMEAGCSCEAQVEIRPDAWYFDANRQPFVPFAVLLEIGLQPCGWLAAYAGSALTSDVDLSFRNLGGEATQVLPVPRERQILTTRVRMTSASTSGGMIIQHYDLSVFRGDETVYEGTTYFGFFSKAALANQVGIREAEPYEPTGEERARSRAFPIPNEPPFPEASFRMVEEVTCYVPDGGPDGLGFIRGRTPVDPEAWFFAAHFHQDPVWPGSLGLESFLQLLKVVARERWGTGAETTFEAVATGRPHRWVYRGQILPSDEMVTVQAVVTALDDARREVRADGHLMVDGRIIYEMRDFVIRVVG